MSLTRQNRIEKYIRQLQLIYETYNKEAAKLALRTPYEDGEFSFNDYPQTKREINKLLRSWSGAVGTTIKSGIINEWGEANKVVNNLIESTYNKRRKEPPPFRNNQAALDTFIKRTKGGMNLSQRVWNLTDDYKSNLEAAISIAIDKGQSATQLSKKISQYLHDFSKLQQDYTEKFGAAAKIKDCEYRSARLARTEINMAYRKSEQTRWEKLDFVLGYEIKRSGKYKCPVCESLTGKYPKDFEFSGWHPNCFCISVAILNSEDDFWAWDGRGKPPKSDKEITDVPENFKNWVRENKNRMDNAKSKPYWVTDNKKYIEGLSAVGTFTPSKTTKEAEEWIVNNNAFIKQADYSNISVKDANRLNKHITALEKTGFLKGSGDRIIFKPFKAKAGDNVHGSYQMMKHGTRNAVLRIDVNVDKSLARERRKAERDAIKRHEAFLKKADGWIEEKKAELKPYTGTHFEQLDADSKRFAKEYMDKISEDLKSLERIRDNEIKDFDLSKAVDRQNRGARTVVGESVEDYLTHEYGHILHANMQINYDSYPKDVQAILQEIKTENNYAPDREKILFNLYGDAFEKQSQEYWYEVSEYAATTGAEYFAESFTMYIRGEPLPDKRLEKLFKLIVKR